LRPLDLAGWAEVRGAIVNPAPSYRALDVAFAPKRRFVDDLEWRSGGEVNSTAVTSDLGAEGDHARSFPSR